LVIIAWVPDRFPPGRLSSGRPGADPRRGPIRWRCAPCWRALTTAAGAFPSAAGAFPAGCPRLGGVAHRHDNT